MLVNKIAVQIIAPSQLIINKSQRILNQMKNNEVNIIDVMDELRCIQEKANEINEWAIALQELDK